MSRRQERLILLAIFLFALGVRGVYIYQIRDSPFFETPFGDPEYHDKWALRVAGGDWLGDKVFFRAPLYPYLLGLTYRIFGHNFLAPRILQAMLGAISCLLIYFVGKGVFDWRVGMLSGGIASIYGPFIYFEGELLITSLIVFLDLSLILLLLKARNLSVWLCAGVVLGLSAIARPTILIFLPFLLLWMWLRHRGHFRRYAPAVLGGVVLFVAPVAFRNYLVGKDLVLVASQGGVNFYLGNNPQADGASAIFPGIGDDWDEVSFAQKDVGRSLKPSEVSRYYYLKGMEFLKEKPGSFLKLLAKKVYLFLNGYEISNNQYIYRFGDYSPLLRVLLFRVGETRLLRFALPFGIICPLGISGLLLSMRNRRASLVRFFLFSYTASVIGFFVCSRYRTPLYPIFILFASFALFSLGEKLTHRELRPVLVSLPVILALFWFANSNLYGEDFLNPAQHRFNLGTAHLKRGEYAEAVGEYEEVLEIDPVYPRTHLNLGVAYHKQGLLGEAKQEYEKELKIWSEEARAYNNLGVIYRSEGAYEEAIRCGRRAIQIRPSYGEAYLNLGLTWERVGDLEAATEAYSKALDIEPSLAEGHNRLGVIYLEKRESEKAIFHCGKAVGLEPANPSYRYNLGLAYASGLRYEEAIGEFREALSIDSELFPAYHNLGMAYLVVGDLKRASESLEEALRINPDSPDSRYLLEVIRQKGGANRETREPR